VLEHLRGHLFVNICILSYLVLTYKGIPTIISGMAYRDMYRLKALREGRGLTQDELAKLSGVSRPTIAALELGYRRAYEATTAKLAKALKCKPSDLRRREERRP